MHFKNNPRLYKKAALFVLTCTILILGTVTVFRAALFEKSRTDLTVYLRAAEAIQNHEDIYKVVNSRHWHYVYMPLLAVLLIPFTSLPLALNAGLWYLLSIAALWGVWRGLARLYKTRDENFWLPLACVVLALPPLLNTCTRGQLGILSLYLTLLTFLLDWRGKKWLAGFVLGFAIILKMSPLLILPLYFLLHKNWRALLACVMSGLLFGVILPSFVLTPQLNFQYLLTYFTTLSKASGSLSWKSYLWEELITPFASDNQSFYAIATRLFWKSEAAFMEHSNNLIRSINLTFLLILSSLIAWLVFREKNFSTFRFSDFKSKAFAPTSRFTEFSLLSMVMLFTSPVTQPHHYTPLMLLGAAAFLNMETNPPFKKILLGSLVICFICFAFGMLIEPLAFIGLPFWGSLLLWSTVFVSRIKIA